MKYGTTVLPNVASNVPRKFRDFFTNESYLSFLISKTFYRCRIQSLKIKFKVCLVLLDKEKIAWVYYLCCWPYTNFFDMKLTHHHHWFCFIFIISDIQLGSPLCKKCYVNNKHHWFCFNFVISDIQSGFPLCVKCWINNNYASASCSREVLVLQRIS